MELAPAVHTSCSGNLHSLMPHLTRVFLLSHSTASATSGLTSAPTRVSTPHTLITLHKVHSDDATALDAGFKKSLSTTKRIIALANNNLFAGFYVVTIS